MSVSETQSRNNSISINNELNQGPNLMVNMYAKDLRKQFLSMKSEIEVSKLIKNKPRNYQRKPTKDKLSNSKSFSRSKPQEKPQTVSPIEFFGELQDFVKKENMKKFEEEKVKEKIRQKEEKKKINEENIKEQKSKKKIESKEQKYENFWKKVKYYIDKKNEHISEIAYKLKLRSDEQDKKKNSRTKINKTSSFFYSKSRQSLYQHKNINERTLNKELNFFYNFSQNERRNNENSLSKTQKYNNYIDDEEDKSYDNENRYQKFYEKKLIWLKKKDEKIKLRRKYLDQKDKSYLKSFSFSPNINKRSIKLINKRDNFLSFLENRLSTEKTFDKIVIDKNEIYQKYLATIKPYMSFYYEKDSPFYKRYKRNFITPNKKSNKSINIGMIHVNKGNNIRIIKEKKINIINSEEEKGKTENNSPIKKNIFNIFKPEKKNNKNKDENEKNKENNKNKNIKSELWWKKLNDLNKNKTKKKKNNKYNGLYQVNVRENCSWNKICVNNIFPVSMNKELLNDFF